MGPLVAASRVIRRASSFPRAQRLVLVALLLRCKKERGSGEWSTTVGQVRLAEDVGLRVRATRDALHALRDGGWIVWTELHSQQGYRRPRKTVVVKGKVLALASKKGEES